MCLDEMEKIIARDVFFFSILSRVGCMYFGFTAGA